MKIGFITSNHGKVEEISKAITPLGHQVTHLSIDYPEPQADTLEEVARFGLKWITHKLKYDTTNSNEPELQLMRELDIIMLEDSGLFVHALNNFPGVYSKFVFKTISYNGVLRLLRDSTDTRQNRSAHFESCIACLSIKDDPGEQKNDTTEERIKLFKGKCNGMIANEARGTHGFGYDPIFIPNDATKTFAEMNTSEKNRYSHRGKAIELFQQFLANK